MGQPPTALVFGAPRLPAQLVKRKRVSVLLQHTAHAPITVLRAPSGTGKSTVLLSWIHGGGIRPEPCIWASLGLAAPTREGCWRRVYSLLRASGLLTSGDGLELAPPSGEITIGVLADLFLQTGPCTLVLDDFQRVDDPAAATDVAQLVEACPDVHVKVITQRPCALEDPLTYSTVRPVVLGPQQLALTPQESSDLALLLAPHLTKQQRNRLVHLSDGTALLLRSFLLAPDLVDDVARLVQTGRSGGSVPTSSFTRVVHELLRGEPELASLLAKLAIPPLLPRALAAHLAAPGSAEPLLRHLERDGYGWWIDTDAGEIFHLHMVVASVVRASMEQDPAQAEWLLQVRRECAVWFSEHGFVLPAAAIARDLDDSHLMAQILTKNFWRVFEEKDPRLLEFMKRLNLRELLQEPLLCLLMALYYNAHPETVALAQRFFRAGIALARVGSGKSDPIGRMQLNAVLCGALRVAGAYRQSLVAFHRGLDIADALPPEVRSKNPSMLHTLLLQGTITQLHMGHFREAEDASRQGISVGVQSHPRTGALASSYAMSAFLAVLAGDIPTARTLSAKAWAAPRFQGWEVSYEAAQLAMVDSRIALADLDLPTARAALERMRPHLDTIEQWPFLWWELSVVGLLDGHALTTRAEFQRALGLAADRPRVSGFLQRVSTACKVLLDLGTGQVVPSGTVRARDELSALIKMLMLFRGGHPDQMLALADRWLRGDGSSMFVSLPALVLRAEATRQLGHPEQAVPMLQRAFSLAARNRDLLPLTVLGGSAGASLMEAWETVLPTVTPQFDLRKLPPLLPLGAQIPLLSSREAETLQDLAAGLTAQGISRARHVSVNTVKSQLKSLYRKLGASSREDALVRATTLGLLCGSPTESSSKTSR